ncbi:WG repeat-containing protein [Pedobacter sp. BS3]|uniref:WG repeat-containing protein n=1 Tax=Pedobacter sp. BS3 TaxID=2567937 RepID=UPI0011EE65C1|nr:WG repeat-containing protein [Pedobacter sp. BS3]TZF84073.1 WG repeat-containing protein [Pedobacter sp. BS3]
MKTSIIQTKKRHSILKAANRKKTTVLFALNLFFITINAQTNGTGYGQSVSGAKSAEELKSFSETHNINHQYQIPAQSSSPAASTYNNDYYIDFGARRRARQAEKASWEARKKQIEAEESRTTGIHFAYQDAISAAIKYTLDSIDVLAKKGDFRDYFDALKSSGLAYYVCNYTAIPEKYFIGNEKNDPQYTSGYYFQISPVHYDSYPFYSYEEFIKHWLIAQLARDTINQALSYRAIKENIDRFEASNKKTDKTLKAMAFDEVAEGANRARKWMYRQIIYNPVFSSIAVADLDNSIRRLALALSKDFPVDKLEATATVPHETVLPGGYKAIQFFDQWSLTDNTGTELTTRYYEGISFLSEGYFKASRGHLQGILDKNGDEIIPPKYKEIELWGDKYFKIAADINEGSRLYTVFGLADKTGKEIIPPKYDSINSVNNGFALVYLSGHGYYRTDAYGFIDTTGKEVIPLKYDIAHNFSEGLAAVYVWLSGGWKFIDKTGKDAIPGNYNDVLEDFKNGKAKVKQNGREFYIDKTGKEVK